MCIGHGRCCAGLVRRAPILLIVYRQPAERKMLAQGSMPETMGEERPTWPPPRIRRDIPGRDTSSVLEQPKR